MLRTSMPKASMNKSRQSLTRKHDVWATQDPSRMQSIPEPHRMEAPSKRKLWACVDASDLGHHFAALRRRPNVCQRLGKDGRGFNE